MIKFFQNCFLCLIVFGALVTAKCPSPNGTYPVAGACDAYIECKDGVEKERLCPDGLLYNEKSTGYPCSYPIDVECSDRQARFQAPQPTDECPHQFGYYRMGDSSHCGQFKNCASGRAYVLDCPDGLAWNPETYKCDWPDQVSDCDAEAYLGFSCPTPPPKSSLLGDQELEYEFYPSKDDCQLYFICIEGRPRRIGCGEDRAFNPETQTCDDIENVATCSAEIRQRGEAIKAARLAALEARKSSSFQLPKRG